MKDPRSFATHVVGAAIAIVGLAVLLGGVALAATGTGGGILAGLVAVAIGLAVVAAAGFFLLVPLKIDELEESGSVRVRERE